MRSNLIVVYLLARITMCRLTHESNNLTTPLESVPTTTTVGDATAGSDYFTESTYPYLITRIPHYLRLGNQTVDINKSFKVPQMETTTSQSVTNSTLNGLNITKSDLRDTVVSGNKTITLVSETNSQVSNDSFVLVVNTEVAVTRPSVMINSNTGPRSWQGTKHEHEGRYGPRFEDAQVGYNSTVVVQAGDTAIMDCRVSLLRDKTVSWVRRKTGEPPLLLTVGAQAYTGDTRYTVQFRYPGNWRLQLVEANRSDEGLYECQLSTHPPRVISVYLHVNTFQVAIVDESGVPLREQYYEAGSTLSLNCVVRGVAADSGTVWWLHGARALHRDCTRGGVGVRTEAVPAGANSTLRVSRLAPADAGNYTCALPSAPNRSYTVLVHVLNESLAELQQGSCNEGPKSLFILLAAALAVTFSFVLDAPS